MPEVSDPIEGVHHHVNAHLTDDGQVQLWVKDRYHTMGIEEASKFASHIQGLIRSHIYKEVGKRQQEQEAAAAKSRAEAEAAAAEEAQKEPPAT